MPLDLSAALPPSGHDSTTDDDTGDEITLPTLGLVSEVWVYLDDEADGTYELEGSSELSLGFGAWVRVWELPAGVPADLRPETVTIRSGSATAPYQVRTVPAGRT